MGTRQSSHGKQLASWPRAVALVVSIVGLIGGVTAAGVGAQTTSTPFQCKKKYKPGKERTRCIKRLVTEKPGTSCKHPLESGVDGEGFKTGDTKDFSINVKKTSVEVSSSEPEPKSYQLEAVIHNPRIVICSAAVTEVVNNLTTGKRDHQVYHPAIGAHGGVSAEFSISPRPYAWWIEVFGRLVK